MDFLLSHWHCIIPAIAIVIVMLVQGRGKKIRTTSKRHNFDTNLR
ncbi:hypothetical protein AGMMS50268_41470 [Spirochaetia bacterium]|nr:hypothetical protein AGMMS50268_41470 [Spirochaetia bacterium]